MDAPVFRPVGRSDRQLSSREAEEILASQNNGILSVLGDDGYPYGVPVNYAWVRGKLYFHSTARQSHKLDAIRNHSKVCFTVVGRHELVEQALTTRYESVIVFGTARILKSEREKREAMAAMMDVLAPAARHLADSCQEHHYVMVEITPRYVTGKARK